MTLAEHDARDSHDAVYHALFLTGLPGRLPTAEVVARHAAHLAELDGAGKLVLAGPFLGRFAGLLVLRTASAGEAIRIAEEDPMIRGGFQSYEVVSWAQATARNNYQPDITTRSQGSSR
ncbi:MAG TPA: YciI family protein [Gemmatimonadaceae bacterium]|nr:YciI family protein [Gemmatimonadaceae bacterium]